MLCHTTAYIFTSDELSYFDALLYVLQGYVTPSKCKYVAVLNNLKLFWILSQGSGREPDPGADRGGLRGVEKVLEREREPREPERNHRSSTTRALPGTTSGRLREPMSTATPSPVGRFENL